MSTRRLVLIGAVVVAVVVVAIIATGALRDPQQVAVTPSPTPTLTTPSASPTVSPAPSAASAGTITGRLSYPSEFIPPLTIYAVSVTDSHVLFSVKTPRYGADPSVPPTPGPPIPPYQLPVAPGTYFVYAFRNDSPIGNDVPVVYSQFAVKCQQASPPPTSSCQEPHTLVPVTVLAGATVARIDLTDWFCNIPGSTCPPRPQ